MLNLSKESIIKDAAAWKQVGVELPEFDVESMIQKTAENPEWIHFGAGNIFRAFIAVLQQNLLNQKKADTGIVAVETYDFEIIDRVYTPNDNLGLVVIMNPDGSFDKKIMAAVSESLVGDSSREEDWKRLESIFTKPSLKMASFTITEKGYNLKQLSGEYFPDVQRDMEKGPEAPSHVMSKVAALVYARYRKGLLPIALVSMDNCAENGKRFYSSVTTIAKAWVANGLVEEGFLGYLNDPEKVSFPWTMIDKITPRPSENVQDALAQLGIGGMQPIQTSKNTFIAPFVNAEGPEYLVIEDSFPNGRPPLELSGVIFTDRETVDKVEKMKVGTCLNPLHTAMSIYGCLLGFESIADEMKDPELKKLVEKIGYDEGLPVVINPGVIDPNDFIKEVIEVRLPNPYIPDTPQRIVTDTSQKLAIRFGQTIKAYEQRPDLDPRDLKVIPLVIAGWCRYLMGVDDEGNEMPLSPDPMIEILKPYLLDIKLGDPQSAEGKLTPIFSNSDLLGVDLYKVGLGERAEAYFKELIAGKGAVRALLKKVL